ncbi:hypothetical protein IW262DRAFT_1461941 [Armillaria fumosa]|nr:hypothetical protein IW262DRAFT_1461941 [Armillaria fumosa]
MSTHLRKKPSAMAIFGCVEAFTVLAMDGVSALSGARLRFFGGAPIAKKASAIDLKGRVVAQLFEHSLIPAILRYPFRESEVHSSSRSSSPLPILYERSAARLGVVNRDDVDEVQNMVAALDRIAARALLPTLQGASKAHLEKHDNTQLSTMTCKYL